MFRSLRWQISIPYVLLIVLLSVVLTLMLTQLSRRIFIDDLDDRLRGEAVVLAADLSPLLTESSMVSRVQPRVDALAGSLEARITVIAPDGRVLADSHEDPTTLENNANRPEVRDALSTGIGRAVRFSDSAKYDMRYLALSVDDGAGSSIGVVRVALSLSEIDAQVTRLSRIAFFVSGVAALLAGLAGILIARRITGPIEDMTAVVKDMSSGNLDRRLRIESKNELGDLASAYNAMSSRLAATLSQVQEESSTMAAVLSTMDDAVCVISSQGTLLLMNEAATKLFGTERERSLGRRFIEVSLDHEMNAAVQQCIRSQAPQTAIIERPDDRRVLRLIATPVRPVLGQRQGALLIIQDLTELRRLESVRRDFVANISHELRTPLAAIKAIVETLEDGALADTAAAQDFLAKMHSEVDHMTQMVQELLDLSRIESGESPPALSPVAVGDLLIEAVDRLRPQAERAGVELRLGSSADLPMVLADQERIGRVLSNLIHNATKFTPAGGAITVGGHVSGNLVTIRVEDNGVGISPEELPRIFERFYKVDAARVAGSGRETTSGTGLGLAIAKHIVQSHGGTIWAESRRGKGARFFFTLPVAPIASEPTLVSDSASPLLPSAN